MANLDSMCFAFIGCNFWFHTEAHRTKSEIQLRRLDSEDTIWFVALAKEQLALIAENGFHVVPFIFARRFSGFWAMSAESDDASFADVRIFAVAAWSIFGPTTAAGIG